MPNVLGKTAKVVVITGGKEYLKRHFLEHTESRKMFLTHEGGQRGSTNAWISKVLARSQCVSEMAMSGRTFVKMQLKTHL